MNVPSVHQPSDVEQIGSELSLEVGSVISGVRIFYCVYIYGDKKKLELFTVIYRVGLDRFTL